MAASGTLPVGNIIWQSLRIPFVGFRRLVWDAGFLLVVTYATAVLSGVIMGLHGRGMHPGGGLFYVFVAIPVYIVAVLQFLVRWHNTVMSDGAAPKQPFLQRPNRTHWRYFLHLLAIGALLLVASVVIGLIGSAVYPVLGIDMRELLRSPIKIVLLTSGFGLVMNLAVIAAMGRLFLMLPIVATGGQDAFRRADGLVDGRWWPYTQVLFGVLLVGYALSIAETVVSLLLLQKGAVGMTVLLPKIVLGPVIAVISMAVFANAVTLSYKHLLAMEGPSGDGDAAMPEG